MHLLPFSANATEEKENVPGKKDSRAAGVFKTKQQ